MSSGPGSKFSDEGYEVSKPGVLTRVKRKVQEEKAKKSKPPDRSWLVEMLNPELDEKRKLRDESRQRAEAGQRQAASVGNDIRPGEFFVPSAGEQQAIGAKTHSNLTEVIPKTKTKQLTDAEIYAQNLVDWAGRNKSKKKVVQPASSKEPDYNPALSVAGANPYDHTDMGLARTERALNASGAQGAPEPERKRKR